MEQPTALCNSEPAVDEPVDVAISDWLESDLADVATLPLTSLDELAPLRPDARLFEEVLRAGNGMRGGGEGPPGAA